jgi:SNF2 family DNA or RNA helicase
MNIFVDHDPGTDRLIMRYHYSRDLPEFMARLPGATLKVKGKDPHPEEIYYVMKASYDNALAIRRVFGSGVEMTLAAKIWGSKQKRETGLLRSLSVAEDADLKLMPELLPELYELIDSGRTVTIKNEPKPGADEEGKPRPYQKADIAFMAARKNSGNYNHPGLGKTNEVIGAIAESGKLYGQNLVACPVISKETVWKHEWESWVRDVPILITPEGREPRQAMLQHAADLSLAGEPFTLVVNPAMIKYRSEFTRCEMHEGDLCLECGYGQGVSHRDATGHRYRRGKPARVHALRSCDECVERLIPEYDLLFDLDWDWIVLDEVQKMGVYDMSSMTYKALAKLPHEHSVQLSGTPFAGKALNVYHLLHLIEPKMFSNKSDFANQWLNVQSNNNPFAQKASHGRAVTIGELKSCHRHPTLLSDENVDCDLCDEIRQPFYNMLSSHVVRRTKKEYLTSLPDKQHQHLWVEMTPAQHKQYTEFEDEAEVMIDEFEVGAVGVLAEYARLKQFSNAVQTVEIIEEATLEHPMKYKLHPTEDSPKLPAIWEIIEDLGIPKREPVDGKFEQLVIYSESVEMIKMVTGWLQKKGVHVEMLIGATSAKNRTRLQREFQAEGGLSVLCLSTKAAGISINLDRASTGIFLDETWNPDDQEQAEDRCHRGSRVHQVRMIYIRTKGTIQEDIRKHVGKKDNVNKTVLSFRRKRLQERKGQS